MNIKNFLVSLLGVIVQYYDYQMLGLLAAVISKYFFPDFDIVLQILYTYILITISYMAKPFGAIILGKIGDVYGRSFTINISLIGTAFGSFLISILPVYSVIGKLSVILLLLCRMMIGVFTSSGTDGVRLFVFEKIAKHNQCLGAGIVTSSTMIGVLFASISANYFTSSNMPAWAWRIPFAVGSLLGIIVIILRKIIIKDTENYVAKESNYKDFKEIKIFTLIKNNLRLFIFSLILAGTIGSFNQFYLIFLGSFFSDVLNLVERTELGNYRTIAISLYIAGSIFGGYLADKFGKKTINRIGGFLLIIICILLIQTLIKKEFSLSLYLLGAAILPVITVPSIVVLQESVPIVIRYRIFSMAHAVGSICISAPTSSLAIYLYKLTNISWLPVLYFLFVIFTLLITVSFFNKKIIYENMIHPISP